MRSRGRNGAQVVGVDDRSGPAPQWRAEHVMWKATTSIMARASDISYDQRRIAEGT